MDRSQILKIIVVLSSLFFIMQMFPIGTLFLGNPTSRSNQTTSFSFNATLRNYDPYLILPPNATEIISTSELESIPTVKSVSSQNGAIYVIVETRDDVRPVAAVLLKKGLNPGAVANLLPPDHLTISNSKSQMVNLSTSSAIRIGIAPYFAEDSQVPISVNAVHTDLAILDFTSPTLLASPVNVSATLKISKLLSSSSLYSIPFERRTEPSLSQIPNSTLNLNNLVTSPSELTIDQINKARSLPYVQSVFPTYIVVKSNFTDLAQIRSDLLSTALVASPSTLLAPYDNSSSLEFPKTDSFVYQLSPGTLMDEKQVIDSIELTVASNSSYSINDSISGVVSALEIGNYIIPVEFSRQ